MIKQWETRLPGEYTAKFGIPEIHKVVFAPRDWPGKGNCVCLGIPECELQVIFAPGGDNLGHLLRNKPLKNPDVRAWVKNSCSQAVAIRGVLILMCDTREQADIAARRAVKCLPKSYERISLERVDAGHTAASSLN